MKEKKIHEMGLKFFSHFFPFVNGSFTQYDTLQSQNKSMCTLNVLNPLNPTTRLRLILI
jgi:hypothetical protein